MNETNRIWAQFHEESKGFITKTTQNPSDADDILQEIFLRILRNEDKINCMVKTTNVIERIGNRTHFELVGERPDQRLAAVTEGLTDCPEDCCTTSENHCCKNERTNCC